MQFILQTFEKDLQLNVRKTTRLYNILHSTLSIQINDISTYTTTIANSQKLTMLKEKVIVQKVLDLDLRRFPLRIYDVENIANRLLAIYDIIYIGLHWISNFIKQQPKFYIRWNRLYNYQKIQYEDPKIIETWFRLF